jgi:uncharacterized protein YeeX (DUF496 family)
LIIKYNGDWGLGIGDWPIPNPQSPIPNPQSPIPNPQNNRIFNYSDFKLLNLNFKNENVNKVNRYIIPNDKRLLNKNNLNSNLNGNLVLTSSIGNIKNIISGFEQRVEQVKKSKIFLKSTQRKGEQL